MTARHGKLEWFAVDAEAALFRDADMAIVGSDAAAFDRYDAAVAEEYRALVPVFIYCFKCKYFLRELLASPRKMPSMVWCHLMQISSAGLLGTALLLVAVTMATRSNTAILRW